ncbi:hypothetical protein [Streptomyces sp. NPDC093225]|uniref:hypothetical protein n=1 Tax=Streptomyces sp. NPDC093225 TaxID=3366034 RepID=UPI003803490D
MTAIALLAACSPATPPANNVAEGHALRTGDLAGEVFYEHAKVGDSFWLGIPFVENGSSDPLDLTGAYVEDLPPGMQFTGKSAAYNVYHTDAFVSLVREKDGTFDLQGFKDYSKTPVAVKPHGQTDVFYMVQLKVKDASAGIVEGCRLTYRQGGKDYWQKVPCRLRLKVGD